MSPDILDTILSERLADAEAAKRAVPVERLRRAAEKRVHHSLADKLRAGAGPRIIAEVKKASPSAGILCPKYKPAAIAKEYETAGAVAISVLTEPRHFLGSGEHLRQVRKAVSLPILRKDFLGDPYQIYEAAAWGADVVLLIATALDSGTIRRLYKLALALGLEVIIEVRAPAELQVALMCHKAIIGVNNRDLRSMETSLRVSRSLAAAIPPSRLAITESGIRNHVQILGLQAAGYAGFLIGERLLKEGRPGENLRTLLQG